MYYQQLPKVKGRGRLMSLGSRAGGSECGETAEKREPGGNYPWSQSTPGVPGWEATLVLPVLEDKHNL